MCGNIVSWILVQSVLNVGVSMEIINNLYTRKAGNRLVGAEFMGILNPVNRVKCAIRCSQMAECRSFNFHTIGNICFLYDKRIHDFGTYFSAEPLFDYYSVIQDKVTDGEWELVFRGERGNGVKISDIWSLPNADDPRTVNPNCFAIIKSSVNPCGTHFKTVRMIIWASSPIKKVRLNFYKSLDKVVEMIFDGEGSDSENWFSQSRLLSSNWTDLKSSDTAFFSIRGDANRRFYTTTQSGRMNCSYNYGWTMIINAENSYCQFDKDYVEPAFLYSDTKNKKLFDTEGPEADVMAVFVTMV